MNSEQRTAVFNSLLEHFVNKSRQDGIVCYPALAGTLEGILQMAFQDLPVDSIERMGRIFLPKKLEENKDMQETLYKPQFDRSKHGSLYDRGSADSYYGRASSPHWYPEGTGKGEKITNLTPEEIAEYRAGYDDNEESENFKEW